MRLCLCSTLRQQFHAPPLQHEWSGAAGEVGRDSTTRSTCHTHAHAHRHIRVKTFTWSAKWSTSMGRYLALAFIRRADPARLHFGQAKRAISSPRPAVSYGGTLYTGPGPIISVFSSSETGAASHLNIPHTGRLLHEAGKCYALILTRSA